MFEVGFLKVLLKMSAQFEKSCLARLKNVDDYNKFVVFGFVRKWLKSKDIPQLINYIVLLFCPLIVEKFVLIGNYNDIFHLKRTIIKTMNQWENTSFGSITIPSTQNFICKWCIHINKGNDLMIGITSFNEKNEKQNYLKPGEAIWHQNGDSYCYWSKCGKYYVNKNAEETWPEYGDTFGDNDNIYIKLDLPKREISFNKNGVDQGIAYKNISIHKDIKYKLAISMYDKQSSVTIKSFDIC